MGLHSSSERCLRESVGIRVESSHFTEGMMLDPNILTVKDAGVGPQVILEHQGLTQAKAAQSGLRGVF